MKNPIKSNLAKILCDSHAINVPRYQRKYEWEKDKIVAFWNDIVRLTEPDKSEAMHYMGTMVRLDEQATPEGVQQFMVIDGQQRITTLMLLACAIKSFVVEQKLLDDESVRTLVDNRTLTHAVSTTKDYLHIKNLVADDYLNQAGVPRFVPTVFDREYFNGVVEGRPNKRRQHYKNFAIFARGINSATEKMATALEKAKYVHAIFDALRRMNFVYIIIDSHDNPQQVFESINYRGQRLSATDLIRNHILRLASSDEGQSAVYKLVWTPMQQELQGDDDEQSDLFDEFFRAYVAMRQGVAGDGEIYERLSMLYPQCAGEDPATLVKRLSTLKEYAAIYRKLTNPTKLELETPLGRAVASFSRLNFITPMSLLLKFYRATGSHPDDQHVISALAVLESYFVRRSLLGREVKNMAEMFADIVKAYEASEASGSRVADAEFSKWLADQFIALTSLPGGKPKYPKLKPVSNDELEEEGRREDVYHNSRNVTRYVLGEYEISLSRDETLDVAKMEIEHVLPQETEKWDSDMRIWNVEEGGRPPSDQQILDRVDLLVHTLGNLTLISPGGNKALSNLCFLDKQRDEVYGYNHSNFKMTRSVFSEESGRSTWSFADIQIRTNTLISFIKSRFDYNPHWR